MAMNIRRERGKWDNVGCEYEGNNGEFDSNGHICEADTGDRLLSKKDPSVRFECVAVLPPSVMGFLLLL